jgi:hypothetical protein
MLKTRGGLINMYEQFKLRWMHYYHYNIGWCRQGQAIMNVLEEFGYGLYLQLRGTEKDCYYDDSKIRIVLEEAKKWFNGEEK